MSYPQIRLNKTIEIQNVLTYLKEHFKLLSEADIIKMALSKIYFEFKQKENNVSIEQFNKNESEKIESLSNYNTFLSAIK